MNPAQGAPAVRQPAINTAPIPSWSVQAVASMVLAARLIRIIRALPQRRHPEVLVELPVAAIPGVALLAPGVAGSLCTHLPSLGRM